MNILLIMVDQLRLDHCGFSGNSYVETPNIDRIAEGTSFTGCRTVNPICMPARTALLTGKYPHQIGTLAMSGDLNRQHPTLPGALQKTGYYTASIGKLHYLQTWRWATAKRKGLDLVALSEEMKTYGYDYVWETAGKQLSRQNFCQHAAALSSEHMLDAYFDFVDAAGPNDDTIHGNWEENFDGSPWPFSPDKHVDIMTADKTIDVINNLPKDRNFYVHASFCSPHKPFDPPPEYLNSVPSEVPDVIEGPDQLTEREVAQLTKHWRAYRALVGLIDDQIGRIIGALEDRGLMDDTAILFCSDHGEMMGDHGRAQKSIYYKEALTVPLAIRHPRHLTGTRIDSPVELTDITATIAEIAGLDFRKALAKDWPAFHDRIPCRSLMSIVRGEEDRIRDFSFSECGGEWYAVQDDRYKYVRWLHYEHPGTYREELYDLMEDPDELCNLTQQPYMNDHIRSVLQLMRDRKDYVLDSTPPAQTRWAPLRGEHYDPVTDS